MKLYFVPFACSLATRVAVEEAELEAEFIQILPGRMLPDGRPFSAVSPMDYVPAMETSGGTVLSEGVVVLTYIADLAAEGVLAPAPYTEARYQMMRWLNFIATEVHKGVFSPLMTSKSSRGARDWALGMLPKRFDLLARQLEGQDYLIGSFSVADAYLLAVLNWCEHAGVPIKIWPVLEAWRAKMRTRPSVARAMAAEMPLLQAA